ncbi:MAG: nitrilase-related carbon-nitrogen hydrolase, partial [Candidatus Binatia bacterium]
MKPYGVALIQQQTRVIVDTKQRDEIIHANLDRIFELIDWTLLRLGNVKLVAFSEYGIIGQYRPRSVEEWLPLAETIPGEVTERIGKKARERSCYITGNLYERDNDWPGRLFNTSFIVSPEGKVILKYRKNNGPNNLNTTYTGPGDVYSEYIKRYGEDSMFPVAETEIGRLACLNCTDLVFPEMARCLALRGAEVLIHLTA